MPDYGIAGDEGGLQLPASMADIFLALVAVIIMMLIWLVPAIHAPAMLAPAAPAREIWRADIRIDGRRPAVFVAEADGLRLAGPAEHVVPLAGLLGDAGLASALSAARQAGEDVLLVIAPQGHEAAFLFSAAANAAGIAEVVQLRLDEECGFVTAPAKARLCRGEAPR